MKTWSLQELAEKLKRRGLVRNIVLTEDSSFCCQIRGCVYARHIHRSLHREHMCPFILLVLMKLREEYGRVKFREHLPTLTPDGVVVTIELEEQGK